MVKTDFKSVDEYIATHPEGAQAVLQRVRGTIRKALPGADEGISYQIPTFKAARWLRGLFRRVEAALLALSRHRSPGRGAEGRPCTVRGQQGHDPLPALRGRPREVDRAHREVPRAGSRP